MDTATISDAEAGKLIASIFGWGIGITLLIIFLSIWSVVWKAIALWRAGRNNHMGWFIVMFLINTLGILEIIYIFACQPKQSKPAEQAAQPAPPAAPAALNQ